MSTYENTAPKPDVYARVTSQIVNAIEQGTGNLAYAMAYVGPLCLQSHQRCNP
jgi:hypothetical protein